MAESGIAPRTLQTVPFVARLFLRAGIVYLVLTFTAGAVLLCLEAFGTPIPFTIGIEHGHMGFVGWLVNTVAGVALWLLPLNRQAFPQTQGRYPETAARTAFVMLNVGLPLRLIAEPLHELHPSSATAAALVLSALLQLAAIAVIGWIVWKRVYAPPLRPDV